MDVKWVQIRPGLSWHGVSYTARSGLQVTHCGRFINGEFRDDLPAERSCESCLRIIARKADA